MADYVSDDYDSRFLNRKRYPGIRQGYNAWDWGYNPVLPKSAKGSDIFKHLPSEDTFPTGWSSSYYINYYWKDPLPTWDADTVPDPEPDIGDYVVISGFQPPGTVLWLEGTLSAGSETGLYDFNINSGIYSTVLPNAIDLRGVPDATVLPGCYFLLDSVPMFTANNEKHFTKILDPEPTDPTVIEQRPYYMMGQADVPRFKYFPYIWANTGGTLYKTAHYYPVEELSLPTVPYTFHPSFSGATWEDWLGQENLEEIYKDNYRDKFSFYFYRDIDTPPATGSVEEKISLLPIHKAQCPQDAYPTSPATINTARHDMVFIFGTFDSTKVVLKWVCQEGYLKDNAGDDVVEDVLIGEEYASLDATPLEEWMVTYNADALAYWTAENPLGAWYLEVQSESFTESSVGYPFVYRQFFASCKYKVGYTPGDLYGWGHGTYSNADTIIQDSMKEVHLKGRPIKGEGFWWEAEAPSWFNTNYPLT